MKVGDPVIATKRIRLVNGKVFGLGACGIVQGTPPNRGVVHVLFAGEVNSCVILVRSVRLESEAPSFSETLRGWRLSWC
jgi:hypothetical protein